jgi:hypothetical protein
VCSNGFETCTVVGCCFVLCGVEWQVFSDGYGGCTVLWVVLGDM